MAEVVTTGTGEVERTADRAQLNLGYTARAKDRTTATRALTERITAVERLLDRAGVQVRSRNLTAHDIWDGKRRSGAQADLTYLIRVSDLSVLDDLLADLVTSEPTFLHGPSWELGDQVEAQRDAQRQAVSDARQRAEGYAEALGQRLGELIRISDGSAGHDGPIRFAAAHTDFAARSSNVDIGALNLRPQPVTVLASCTTTWQLVG